MSRGKFSSRVGGGATAKKEHARRRTKPSAERKPPPVGGSASGAQSRWLIAAQPAAHWGLVIAAAVLVAWVRLLPLSLAGLDDEATLQVWFRQAHAIEASLQNMPQAQREAELRRQMALWQEQHPEFLSQSGQVAARLRSELTYQDKDGARHVFLGDLDSYHWLRMARNYLRSGTTCDAVVGGNCRDTYTNAPVGRRNVYNHSLHIAAIVALHRLITWFKPAYPLAASSSLVPVIIGVLGVLPAFALGRMLAGDLGGLAAALLSALNPLFLARSIGSDDDVWNVVLPLFMVWAAAEAITATRARRQIGYALTAAAFAGIHAATWSGWTFAYVVVMVALLADLSLEVFGCAIRKYTDRSWSTTNAARAALVVAVFYVAAALFTTLAGTRGYFSLPLEVVRPLIASSAGNSVGGVAQTAWWPDVFSTVAELIPPNLGSIAATMGGPVIFFVSWLGLLVLLVPRAGWKLQHFALLIGGNYLYLFLLTASHLGRTSLLALLASPIAAAILIDLFSGQDAPNDRGAALLVIVWFLGALLLSYRGSRFIMLLVPPFSIAFGVALGRLQQWADAQVYLLRPSAAKVSRPALFAAMAAILILPAQQGYAAARGYLPKMNDSWWNTLTHLREVSPPDAIVSAWWDYGYWIKYVAERRVNADGGSLRTHIPYWTARALAAPSAQESAGLLRMLDCGSDATPDAEGHEGAYGKLLSYGVDGLKAQEMISELAQMGRRQAQAYLAQQKFSASAQADILRSTHCDPPPGYLLLSSAMQPVGAVGAWWYLANWDFRRAYLVESSRLMPQDRVTADLVSRFGYSQDEARSLYERAASLKTPPDEQRFIDPALSETSAWLKCDAGAGGTLLCDANLRIDRATLVKKVIVDADNPTASRFVVVNDTGETGGAGPEWQITPAAILITGGEGISDTSNPSADSTLGVLVDLPNRRVRLAAPGLLRSTFSRLMYLDGRYDKVFEKVHDETGFGGERVTLWRINWQLLEASSK